MLRMASSRRSIYCALCGVFRIGILGFLLLDTLISISQGSSTLLYLSCPFADASRNSATTLGVTICHRVSATQSPDEFSLFSDIRNTRYMESGWKGKRPLIFLSPTRYGSTICSLHVSEYPGTRTRCFSPFSLLPLNALNLSPRSCKSILRRKGMYVQLPHR
jgi:hypothetical protein